MTRAATAATASCCAGLYESPLTSLLLGDSFHPGGLELTRRLARAALIGRGTRVLDVACGRGSSAAMLVDDFGCRVVGVDYTTRNLPRIPEEETDRSPRFLASLADELPFPDSSFDVVMCECALCTFADKGTALAEIIRVLRPGGRIALSDVVLNAPIPDVLGGVLGQALCIAGALSADGFRELAEVNGFKGVRVRDASFAIMEMIAAIDKRLILARRMVAPGGASLSFPPVDADEVLAAARKFVGDGGAGYVLLTGRKPGSHPSGPPNRQG